MTAFFTIFGAALTGFGLVTDGNGRRSMLSSLQSSSEIDASSEWYRTGHSLGLTAGTTDWTWTTDLTGTTDSAETMDSEETMNCCGLGKDYGTSCTIIERIALQMQCDDFSCSAISLFSDLR